MHYLIVIFLEHCKYSYHDLSSATWAMGDILLLYKGLIAWTHVFVSNHVQTKISWNH